MASAHVPAVMFAMAAPMPKTVKTWSVVVRNNYSTETPREVVEKVVERMGSRLGVRVCEIELITSCGALVRTPAVTEKKKTVANTSSGKLGSKCLLKTCWARGIMLHRSIQISIRLIS